MGLRSDTEWVLASLGRTKAGVMALRGVALKRIDPVIRPWVRTRVKHALTEASLSTDHAFDDGHVSRVAFLLARGARPDGDEIAAIREAFDAELARRTVAEPTRRASVVLATGALLMAALIPLYALAPESWLDRNVLPISPDAFAKGGRPNPGSKQVRQLFVTDIPAFVVTLDGLRNDARGSLQDRKTELDRVETPLKAHASDVLGRDGASFLTAVLDQSRTLASATGPVPIDAYLRSVDAFNAALERQGLGYYLDAEVVPGVGGQRVYLASFAVEEVRWYVAGSSPVRVLHLARQDNLNFVRGVLGFTRPNLRDALVLVERVDDWLIDDVMPALETDGRLTLANRASRAKLPPNLDRLETRAGQEVRRQLRKLTPSCPSLERAGALFRRRRDAFEELSARAIDRGMRIVPPAGYEVELAHFASVETIADPRNWHALEEVRDGLDDDTQRACFAAVRKVLISSIDRHEAQHRIDYASGGLERLPVELERRVGALERFGLRSVRAERSIAETSAYLSELARGPEIIKLNLALLSQHVLNSQRWGTTEYFAALVIFEGLAREIGLSVEDPVRRPATERVANTLIMLLALDDAEIARAARRLWESLMLQKLVKLTLRNN